MRVTLLSLSDFASVRGGLLTLVAGGISELVRPSFPSTLEAWAAVTIEIEGRSIDTQFELNVVDDSDEIVASQGGRLNAHAVDESPNKYGYFSLEFDVRALVVPAPGHYRLEIRLGGKRKSWLHFYAVQTLPADVG